MYKKLAGILTLVAMLTIFVLPMQVQACESCGHPNENWYVVGGWYQGEGVFSEYFIIDSDTCFPPRDRDLHRSNMLCEHLELIDVEYSKYMTVEVFATCSICPAMEMRDMTQLFENIEPFMGCCLNQSIAPVRTFRRIWRSVPGNPLISFCHAYEWWSGLECLSCGFARLVLDRYETGCGQLSWTSDLW